jgi:hypothetical protein
MFCECSKLPQVVVESPQDLDGFNRLLKRIEKIESGKGNYLARCRDCKQLWRITDSSGDDRRYFESAVKINDSVNWQTFNASPLFKERAIKKRGGLTNEKCIWQGCENRRVKGVAYCIDHLFQTGATE